MTLCGLSFVAGSAAFTEGGKSVFQKGDYVVYRNTGVYKVEEIGTLKDAPAAMQDRLYYHLAPVHGSSLIHIPVDSPIFMLPVITKEQAQDLITAIPSIEEKPNYSRNQKVLNE